jgi:hypothetical protein
MLDENVSFERAKIVMLKTFGTYASKATHDAHSTKEERK